MPSTVLQKQLLKINGGKEKQRSLHASLVFDRSRDVSLREVYDLARSAFEKMIVLDHKFNEFMDLFSMHRMSVFRSSLVINLTYPFRQPRKMQS